MNIRLSKEQKIKILNSEDVYKIMQQILMREKKIDRNKEHLWIICLASNNRILLIELISLGTVNKTLIEPMEVFSFALQKRAVKIIMVHNHPSGEIVPSPTDIKLTDKMLAIGKFVNVPLIDHLIITEEDYFSFTDNNLLQQIQHHSNYDLSFNQLDMLREELKEAEKNKSVEMAKRMIDKNYKPEDIMEITGLTQTEVLALMKGLDKYI